MYFLKVWYHIVSFWYRFVSIGIVLYYKKVKGTHPYSSYNTRSHNDESPQNSNDSPFNDTRLCQHIGSPQNKANSPKNIRSSHITNILPYSNTSQ